jgi:tRNA modification GTPase
LARANESLARAWEVIRKGGAEELAALEIRETLESLGELTGESAQDDILKKIFSGFCIGK